MRSSVHFVNKGLWKTPGIANPYFTPYFSFYCGLLCLWGGSRRCLISGEVLAPKMGPEWYFSWYFTLVLLKGQWLLSTQVRLEGQHFLALSELWCFWFFLCLQQPCSCKPLIITLPCTYVRKNLRRTHLQQGLAGSLLNPWPASSAVWLGLDSSSLLYIRESVLRQRDGLIGKLATRVSLYFMGFYSLLPMPNDEKGHLMCFV